MENKCTVLMVTCTTENVGAMTSKLAVSHHSWSVIPQTSVIICDPLLPGLNDTEEMKLPFAET